MTLAIIWGSSFILIKRGLDVYTPVQVGLLRISIACIFLIPFIIFRLSKIKWSKAKLIALSAVVGNGIPAYLFAKAETVIDSSLAGILNALSPLFTLILGIMFFKYHTKWYNILGVFVGLIGATGLLYFGSEKDFYNNIQFSFLVIIATILYALNANMIKSWLSDVDPISVTSVGYFIIGVPAIIMLFTFTDFTGRILTHDGALISLGYICILAIIGSALSLIAYYYLIGITDAMFGASVTYIIPVGAIIWGIFDGEKINWSVIIWIALILGGVYLVSRNNKEKII